MTYPVRKTMAKLAKQPGLIPDDQLAGLHGRPARGLPPSRVPAVPNPVVPNPVVPNPVVPNPVVPNPKIVQAPAYVAKPTGPATAAQQHLVARGDTETEVQNGHTYVRVYQTVFAPVEGSSTYKDVQQDPADGRIVFKGSGDFWLNAGRPWRAFHYVRTYRGQGLRNRAKDKLTGTSRDQGQPIVRSFLIPYEAYQALTGQTIAESQKEALGEEYNLNTDTNKDTDQFLIRQDNKKALVASALPGSLVSYVIDQNIGEYLGLGQQHHGEVRPLGALANRLGIPDVVSDRFILPVVTKPDGGIEIASAKEQAERAGKLGALFDLSFVLEREEERYQGEVEDFDKLSAEFKVTWPADFEARQRLRGQIAAAATYSLMPTVIQSNYEQASGKALGYAQTKSGEDFDPFTARQQFPQVELEKREPPQKEGPPTPEMIKQLQDEAKARKKAAEEAEKIREQQEQAEEDAFGGIFD